MNLDDLKALEAKATPGPWECAGRLADEIERNGIENCIALQARIVAALRSQPAGTPAWAVKDERGTIIALRLTKPESGDLAFDNCTCVPVLIVEKK